MNTASTSSSSANIQRTLSRRRPPPPPPPPPLPLPLRRQPPPPNPPCMGLLGSRDDYNNICVPLYNASIKGDWEAAEVILLKRPELVGYAITGNYDTALHIAASAKSNMLVEKFVEKLVDLMTPEQLLLHNRNRSTALFLAAQAGNVKIAKTMVNKHSALLDVPGSDGMPPLYVACLFAQREMVKYLYDHSKKMSGAFWTPQDRGWVLQKCVEADFFDVALKIVTDRVELANDGIVLTRLAPNTDAFREIRPHFIWRVIRRIFPIIHEKFGPAEKPTDAMQLLRIMWTNIMKLPMPDIDKIMRGPVDNTNPIKPDEEGKYEKKKYSSHVLFIAAEMGNTEFVAELIRQYPDLLWKINDNRQTIFHVAVLHRREGIYNFLQEVGSMKDHIASLKDEKGNNILHLAAKSAKKERLQDIPGVALQLQQELVWFKEVESMMPPSYQVTENKDCLTPHELFTNEHKELLSAGEKWMKDTASQSMVVAALITTIVFAVVFTVPGGYNQDNGLPRFLHKRTFIVFVISDAISLTFSSISLLIFLSMLTSRYAEQDFLESLPKRLMRGLATLFLSIAAMMVTFSVSFFIFYQDNLIWVPIVICVFASIPVILYAKLQSALLVEVYHSTYGSKNLFKPTKIKLYLQNPKF